MGIRFYCPNGHKLNVKAFQAGRRGICPYCGTKFLIPSQSTRKSSKEDRAARRAIAASAFPGVNPAPQDVAPDVSGKTAERSAQPTLPSAFPATPINANADILAQSAGFSSQHDGEGTGLALPVLSSPVIPSTNVLTTFSADDPTLALKPERPADPLTEAGDVVWYARLHPAANTDRPWAN